MYYDFRISDQLIGNLISIAKFPVLKKLSSSDSILRIALVLNKSY